jgi:DNA-binding transcriptional ArsR family regulator
MPVTTTDDVFTAIANPVRRSLLDALAAGAQPVNKLARRYKVSRPAISQHLRILVDAGLVEGQREGRTNTYVLRPDGLVHVQHWLDKHEELWQQRLQRLGRYLDRTAARPRRRK